MGTRVDAIATKYKEREKKKEEEEEEEGGGRRKRQEKKITEKQAVRVSEGLWRK